MALLNQQEYINCLAELVSYGNASFPPAQLHLKAILNLCKKKWICDFLFNTDPTYLTVLTAPSFLRNAIACDIKISRFQPPNIPNPYAYHFDGSIVFVPAFSIDHISVGFGIEEKSWSTTHALTGPNPSSAISVPRYVEQFRYVRDDKLGTLTIVYDCDDYFQFEFVAHLSTKRRQRSTSRFNRQTVMTLVERDKVLDEAKVMPAMMCLALSDEYRRCPTCGAPPELACCCTLDLTPPTHPLDFSNHARQMSTHTGCYDGLIHMMRLVNGATAEQGIFGNRINMQGGTSRELITRLAQWVVRRHLQGVHHDPLGSMLPPPDEAEQWESNSGPLLVQPPPTMSTAFEAGATVISQGIVGYGVSAPEIQTSHAMDNDGIEASCAVYADTAMTTPVASRQLERAVSVADANNSPPIEQHDSSEKQNEDEEEEEEESREQNEGDEVNERMSAAEWQQMERLREKERKKELKKHRNRLSAQRSNLKKKRENDAKKAELKNLKEREVQYRELERQLREENMRLRRLVGGSGSGSDDGDR